jgi:four helix bundle suffix protein
MHGRYGQNGFAGKQRSIPSMMSIKPTYPEIAANGALALITVANSLLSRQLAAQAAAFERDGGFTERLYKTRNQKRQAKNPALRGLKS